MYNKYLKRCFDDLVIGNYYKLITPKTIGILLSKVDDSPRLYFHCELELLTKDGIIIFSRPDRLIELELSGEINKAKAELIEAKLEYL